MAIPKLFSIKKKSENRKLLQDESHFSPWVNQSNINNGQFIPMRHRGSLRKLRTHT